MSLQTITGAPVASIVLGDYQQDRYTATSTMLGTFQLLNDDLPVALSYVPNSTFGMPLTDIEAEFRDGVAHYVWTYQSARKDLFFPADFPVLEIDGETQQEPITAHPKINDFISKYLQSWDGGTLVWKQTDPDGAGGGRTGLEANGNTVVNNISPLYGVETYLASTASYSYENIFAKDALPADLVSTLGYISTDPPDVNGAGALGTIPASGANMKRNWLYSGVRLFQVGDAFVVRKNYLLSGFGGWEPLIYAP